MATGFALAIASLAVLIFSSITPPMPSGLNRCWPDWPRQQAKRPTAFIPGGTGQGVSRALGNAQSAAAQLPDFDREGQVVPAGHGGYVQTTDDEALAVAAAARHGMVVRVEARPGCFVCAGDALITVAPLPGSRTL